MSDVVWPLFIGMVIGGGVVVLTALAMGWFYDE